MSTLLPAVNVANAVVGQQFTIDFTQFIKVSPEAMFFATQQQAEHAHVQVYNDSHVGFSFVLSASGTGGYIPAGGWQTIQVARNDNLMTLTATYVLSNPQVTMVLPTYFAPGENVPAQPSLGNSPIGIGGNVATTNISSLSNEGAASNTLVIDMGDTGFSQLFTQFNDGHCLWQVDQSGVKHQVLKVQTSGNPLQLGQSGDTTEVLGKTALDSDTTLLGMLIANIAATTTINGTAGTATIFYPIWGSAIKIAIVFLNGYSSSANGQFVFPSAVANNIFSLNLSGFTGAYQLMNGVTAISSRILTALAVGGGTTTASTAISKKSLSETDGPADRLQLNSGFVTDTGIILLIGQ